MQRSIALRKLVVRLVKRIQFRLQGCIIRISELLLQHIVNGFLYGLIVGKAFCLGVALYLLVIQSQWYCHASLRHTQPALIVHKHPAFLLCRQLVLRLFLPNRPNFPYIPSLPGLFHAFRKVSQHLLLIHAFNGIEAITARTESVALLIAKGHLTGHHLRMIPEIVVDNHRHLVFVTILVCPCADTKRTGLADINGVG